jgi:hypothetical protein
MKKHVLLFALLFPAVLMQAQLQQIIHQSFALDEMNEINLDLYGEYEIEMWPGSEILTETKIKLTNAKNSILKYLIENKRYAVKLDTIDERIVTLLSSDQERRAIKTSKGTCVEEISIRIFMPDFFEKKTEKNWVRSKPLVTKED